MNDIVYLLPGEEYISYIDNNDRKSISYKYIQEHAHIIKMGYQPQLDYLDIVDKVYFKGE